MAVSSEPQGAEVYVNGIRMGVTPVELNLKADKSYSIEYRKEGYESVTRIVNGQTLLTKYSLFIFCIECVRRGVVVPS